MSTTVDLGKITASVTVGTTTTGAAGTNASVSNSGTTQDAVLNFTIPRGAQGVQGQQGSTGPQGPAGPTGPQGPMGDVAVITPEQQAAFTMYSTTGQNTDGPMTQKAVTDAVMSIGKEFGVDNVIGQPYTEGYRLVFRNDIVADSSWCYTDYIPINGNEQVTWTFSNTSTVETVAAHLIFYDARKQAAAYFNNIGYTNSREFTLDNANWKYIRASFRKEIKMPLVINGVAYYTDADRGMTGLSLTPTILSQYGIYSFGHSDISTAIFAKRGYRDEISTPNIDRGNWIKIAYYLPGSALVNVSCTGYQLYAGVWSNIETGERVTDEGKLDVIPAWTNNAVTNFSTTHKGILTILVRKSGGADISDSEYNTILNTLSISIVPNIPSVDTRKPFSDDYWFTNTGGRTNYGIENNYYVYVIPCDAGDELYIDASGTKTGMMYMFIKNYIENSATWDYILYNNNVRNTVFNDQTGTATAPEGTKYVVISGFVRNEQAEFTPDVLTINGKNIDLCIDYDAEGVKALGAYGNGIVDDYLPLRRAFRRAGRVVIPDGTYLISLPIDLYSNTEVVMGNNATIKRNLNGNLPNGDYFTILSAYFTATTTAYNGIQNVSVKGGILDMNESINQHGSCVGLMHGKNIVFDGVTFMHVHQGEHFVDLTACKDVKFLNCTFKDMMTASSSTEQIQIDFASIPVAYPYRRFASGSTCYDNTGCENVEVSGCVFKLNNYSPALGNHNPGVHKRIDIHDNFVFGPGVSVSSFDRAAFAFTCNTDFDQYGYDPKNNTDLCLIHHNIINDCKYTVITDSRAAGRIYLRDNVINNFTQVKAPDTSQYVELLNNIETSDN